MKTLRTKAEVRDALGPERRAARTIGLVPTMGFLHEGHLSLIRAARERCDVVVVSLFVNPAQFNDPDDLAAYPRSEREDAQLAGEAGADVLFAPAPSAVYPPGFATKVAVKGVLTESLEGAHRGAEHFHGVTTVVTKLLNMVAPDVGYFGRKDAQQVLVLRRLVTDLDLPVVIKALPIIRESDGLALSSRNVHLDAVHRRRALALPAALRAAHEAVQAGERAAAQIVRAALEVLKRPGVDPEYVALVNPDTLAPITVLDGDALLAIAARVGRIRLIDNTSLSPIAAPDTTTPHAAAATLT
jgi:pantoate--beta-alanine ligase